jgi:hypothetical protein
VTLHFREDGSLDYVVAGADRDVIQLRYHMHGSELVTDEPSAASEERTGLGFTEEGKLVLEYNGLKAYYVRSM